MTDCYRDALQSIAGKSDPSGSFCQAVARAALENGRDERDVVAAVRHLRDSIVAGNGEVGWPGHLGDVLDWCNETLGANR